MTDTIRFRTALCISFFLHFMLLQVHWAGTPSGVGAGNGERLTRELASFASMFNETVTVALENFVESPTSGDGADKARQERRVYLDAVSNAIHLNRFVSPEANRSLIGLAWFSFTVFPDGSFGNIILTESSGNPALDRAAAAAIRESSGKVRRPGSLGKEEVVLAIAVKYQYDW